jgi:L-aminopeptidase/D-esterase-like protein
MVHFAKLRTGLRPAATRLLPLFLLLVFCCGAAAADKPGPNNAITDVPGVRVGHYTVTEGTLRGTTVILFDGSSSAGVDVRGGNPVVLAESYFRAETVEGQADAVVFSGGSFFGLAAVTGVVDYLFEKGLGVSTPYGPIPIVPAAVIYDLRMGNPRIHPARDWGYEAAKRAQGGAVPQGNVGAGAGGTAGKRPGGVPMKGGLGTASLVLDEGVTVGALVVLNPLGDFVNPKTGELYAEKGGFDSLTTQPPASRGDQPGAIQRERSSLSGAGNTTLVLVATDAELTKTQLTKIAQMANDGLARAIRPIHTMLDGDTVFVASVGWARRKKLPMLPHQAVDRIGTAAADVVVRAILNGIQAAESVPGFPSYRDWRRSRP